MLSKRTTTKIEEMINKTFLYSGIIHCVLGFTDDQENEQVTIKTNIKTFKKSYDSIMEFLSYWEPVSSSNHLTPAVVVEAVSPAESRADKMIEMLEENIEKVKKDPTYIPQATSINNNINSIINIEKMRMMVLKTKKNQRN